MGCDIHFLVERRRHKRPPSYGENWTWELLFPEDDDVSPEDRKYARREGHRWMPWEFFSDRNYELFGVLANVRRDGPPIAEPRGLPDDLSSDARKYIDDYGGIDHTPSWLLLSEVLAYDWSARAREVTHPAPFDRFLAMCARVGRFGPSDEIRFVFFFDS